MGLRKPKLNVGKKWASGTVTSSPSTSLCYEDGGTTNSFSTITITGLSFTPSFIVILGATIKAGVTVYPTKIPNQANSDARISPIANTGVYRVTGALSISNGGFTMMTGTSGASQSFNWWAFE